VWLFFGAAGVALPALLFQDVSPLLNSTGRLREDCVGVRTNQPYCADYDDEDHSQHDGVLSDVLALIVRPELVNEATHNDVLSMCSVLT
jgi:hypothetical protein